MRPYLVILLLSSLLAGCAGNDGVTKPEKLIPADKMADILIETHLAEAQVGRYALRSSDSSNMVFNRLQAKLLKKFGVDTSAYRQSYIYYSSHPNELDAIYKDVTDELQKISMGSSGSATAPASGTPGSTSATPGTTLPAALSNIGRFRR